jgi:F420-dependent oxidoreductase-like protein
MTITTTSIAHVRLTVSDITRSRQFYESVFGWPVALEVSDDADPSTREQLGFLFGGVIYDLGGALLGLRPVGTDTFDENRVGLDHVALSVASKDQLDSAAAHLDALGVPHEPVKDIGLMYILEFRDPDNIALELPPPGRRAEPSSEEVCTAMELGVHFIDYLPGDPSNLGPTLTAAATTAEQAGATMFTVQDHFFGLEKFGRAQDPFLEGYTALAFLAGQTETITLSMLVTGVTYRHPGVLAKTVASLDVLSQGRSMLGLGTGWYQREHRGLGVPYPPLRDRFEMLEEALQICRQMWSQDDGPYDGKHYHLAETICEPKPIRRPPIVSGGGGEKKTLRLAAQYADVWNRNGTVLTSDDLDRKVEVLNRHCETVGRDPAEIRKTVGLFDDPFADLDGYLKTVENCAKLGFDVVHAGPLPGRPDPVGFVGRLCDEVLPRMAAIG